jgi:hypothetical protein
MIAAPQLVQTSALPARVPVPLCPVWLGQHNSLSWKREVWSEWQDLNLRPPRPERRALKLSI